MTEYAQWLKMNRIEPPRVPVYLPGQACTLGAGPIPLLPLLLGNLRLFRGHSRRRGHRLDHLVPEGGVLGADVGVGGGQQVLAVQVGLDLDLHAVDQQPAVLLLAQPPAQGGMIAQRARGRPLSWPRPCRLTPACGRARVVP